MYGDRSRHTRSRKIAPTFSGTLAHQENATRQVALNAGVEGVTVVQRLKATSDMDRV